MTLSRPAAFLLACTCPSAVFAHVRALAARMAMSGSPQFPPGYDPNLAAADSRTWAGAVTQLKPDPALTDWSTAFTSSGIEPADELQELLRTFDFDQSSDEEVFACERAVFRQLQHEAQELTGSLLTSGLVQTCLLKRESLPEALSVLLSSKLQEPLPAAFAYSSVGGTRAERATAEEALRHTMETELRAARVRRAIVSDLVKVLVVDPAAEGLLQPMLFFKGFHALATHRIAHGLWTRGSGAWRGAALMLQSRASELFGVDIHPAATIGNGVMLDHGSGVVIGSTAIVGSDVYLLHGVTLGATGKPTNGAKRHPTIGSRVVLGAGCTVLGDIAIGNECTIGAGGIVTKDVPDGSTVVGVNKIVSRPAPATDETDSIDGDEQRSDDDYTWLYDI